MRLSVSDVVMMMRMVMMMLMMTMIMIMIMIIIIIIIFIIIIIISSSSRGIVQTLVESSGKAHILTVLFIDGFTVASEPSKKCWLMFFDVA